MVDIAAILTDCAGNVTTCSILDIRVTKVWLDDEKSNKNFTMM